MKTKTVVIIVVAVVLGVSVILWGSEMLLKIEQSLGAFLTRLLIYFICFAAGWILGRRQLKRKMNEKKTETTGAAQA